MLQNCVNLCGWVFVIMSEPVKTGMYEFFSVLVQILFGVWVCGSECVNPCRTYLLARGACGWGGKPSALVGRTGIKTDYSKAAQWSHSLSSEYGFCLWRLTGLYWSVLTCIGSVWSVLFWATVAIVFEVFLMGIFRVWNMIYSHRGNCGSGSDRKIAQWFWAKT